MLNNILFSSVMMITLLLPVNIQSQITDNVKNLDMSSELTESNLMVSFTEFMKELLFDLEEDAPDFEENLVTPATTHAAESEDASIEEVEEELTEEEELELAMRKEKERIEEWKNNFPVYESDSHQVEFIQRIAPAAVLIAEKYGIYPSVMIAQAALESQWGQSQLAQDYNNLMGTKGSWQGETVSFRTREDVNGQSVYIDAGFSVYDSWASSLYRYGMLMGNGLQRDAEFYKGTWRVNTTSYHDATAWLQGRYASDTTYSTKLNQTIESFNLDQYDSIETPGNNLEELLTRLKESPAIN